MKNLKILIQKFRILAVLFFAPFLFSCGAVGEESTSSQYAKESFEGVWVGEDEVERSYIMVVLDDASTYLFRTNTEGNTNAGYEGKLSSTHVIANGKLDGIGVIQGGSPFLTETTISISDYQPKNYLKAEISIPEEDKGSETMKDTIDVDFGYYNAFDRHSTIMEVAGKYGLTGTGVAGNNELTGDAYAIISNNFRDNMFFSYNKDCDYSGKIENYRNTNIFFIDIKANTDVSPCQEGLSYKGLMLHSPENDSIVLMTHAFREKKEDYGNKVVLERATGVLHGALSRIEE